MTNTTTPIPPSPPTNSNRGPAALVPQPATIGFANLLRSEWTKLRSVRSTYWTAGLAVLASIGLSVIVCARTAYNINHGHQSLDGFDPTLTSLDGLYRGVSDQMHQFGVVIPNHWRAVMNDPFVADGWWQAAAGGRLRDRLGGRP